MLIRTIRKHTKKNRKHAVNFFKQKKKTTILCKTKIKSHAKSKRVGTPGLLKNTTIKKL